MPRSESSKNDEWWTRKEDYNSWCNQFNVHPELDVAADEKNTTCSFFISKELDALTRDWVITGLHNRVVDVWCNPPLSKTKVFILKGLEQWNKYGMNILFVVPTGVISRKYFRPIWGLFLDRKINIIPINRPSFLEDGKEPRWGARNDYILILFKKQYG